MHHSCFTTHTVLYKLNLRKIDLGHKQKWSTNWICVKLSWDTDKNGVQIEIERNWVGTQTKMDYKLNFLEIELGHKQNRVQIEFARKTMEQTKLRQNSQEYSIMLFKNNIYAQYEPKISFKPR